MKLARRLASHDSTRACLLILAMIAACGLAEIICALTGAGEFLR